MSINDIRTNLEEDVKVDNDFTLNEVSLEDNSEHTKNTKDIKNNLENIDLRKNKNIKVIKTSTKVFDSFIKKSRLKDINLTKNNRLKNLFKRDYFT